MVTSSNGRRSGSSIEPGQCLGHVGEVAVPGSFLTRRIVDQEVVVVCDTVRELRAFYNVCMHRGHRLLDGRGVCKQRIVCPYHAWTYELSGALRHAPRSEKMTSFDAAGIKLREVRMEIFCGLVFVNLDDDAEPLAAQVGHIADDLRSFVPHLNELRWVGDTPLDHECNWKVSVENWSECYHCGTVHRRSVSGVFDTDVYEVYPEGLAVRHRSRADTSNDSPYEYDAARSSSAGTFGGWYIWPNTALICYPGGIVSLRLFLPHSVGRSTYLYRWYADKQVPETVVRSMLDYHAKGVGLEDAEIVRNVQLGLQNRGYQPGPLVVYEGEDSGLSELGVAHFQQLVRKALA